jgi:hypothetical protein
MARSHAANLVSNFEQSRAGTEPTMRDLRGFGNALDVWAQYFETDAKTRARHTEFRNLLHDGLDEKHRSAMYDRHESLKTRIFGDTDGGTEPGTEVFFHPCLPIG